jgi:hypothetical protein
MKLTPVDPIIRVLLTIIRTLYVQVSPKCESLLQDQSLWMILVLIQTLYDYVSPRFLFHRSFW